MNDFIVVSYYTEGTYYAAEALRLSASLVFHKIPSNIEGIESRGDWYKNTQYKPKFLLQMMYQFPDKDIVWVDCDAEFLSYPYLFEHLMGPLSVHVLDHRKRDVNREPELLSGTIFIKNSAEARRIIEAWASECSSTAQIWDQRALAAVIGDKFEKLPAEYCTIYDTMSYIKSPVIKHYQASRRFRKTRSLV